jgi:hypothetical protein
MFEVILYSRVVILRVDAVNVFSTPQFPQVFTSVFNCLHKQSTSNMDNGSATPDLRLARPLHPLNTELHDAAQSTQPSPTDEFHVDPVNVDKKELHPLRRAVAYSGTRVTVFDMFSPFGKRKRPAGGILAISAFVVIASYTIAKLIYLFTNPQLTISSAVLERGNQPLPLCVGCRMLADDEEHATCTVMMADGTLLPMTRVVIPGNTAVVNRTLSVQWVNYHACVIDPGQQPLAPLIFVAIYVHANWTFLRQPEMVMVPFISATTTSINAVLSPYGYARVAVLMTQYYGMRMSAEIGRYNTLDLGKQGSNFVTDFFNSIQITNPVNALSLSDTPQTTLWLSIPPYVIGPAACAFGGDFNIATPVDPPTGFNVPWATCGGLELTLVGHRIITQTEPAESRMSVVGNIFGFAAGAILMARIMYHVYAFQRFPHCMYCVLGCGMCLSSSGADESGGESRDGQKCKGNPDSPGPFRRDPNMTCQHSGSTDVLTSDSTTNLLHSGSTRALSHNSNEGAHDMEDPPLELDAVTSRNAGSDEVRALSTATDTSSAPNPPFVLKDPINRGFMVVREVTSRSEGTTQMPATTVRATKIVRRSLSRSPDGGSDFSDVVVLNATSSYGNRGKVDDVHMSDMSFTPSAMEDASTGLSNEHAITPHAHTRTDN